MSHDFWVVILIAILIGLFCHTILTSKNMTHLGLILIVASFFIGGGVVFIGGILLVLADQILKKID